MQYYEDLLDLFGNVDTILHHFLRFNRVASYGTYGRIEIFRSISSKIVRGVREFARYKG